MQPVLSSLGLGVQETGAQGNLPLAKSKSKNQAGGQGFLDLLQSKIKAQSAEAHRIPVKDQKSSPGPLPGAGSEKELRKAHPSQKKPAHLLPRTETHPQRSADDKARSGEVPQAVLGLTIGPRDGIVNLRDTQPKDKTQEGEIKALAKDKKPGSKSAGLDSEIQAVSPEAMAGPKSIKKTKQEEARISLIDRRTETREKTKSLESSEEKSPAVVNMDIKLAKPQETRQDSEFKIMVNTVRPMTGEGGPVVQSHGSRESAPLLASYLQEKGNVELVQQAKIILKDQNAGEIRMTLYPEHLGKVRLNLSMSEGSLVGQIYVENNTVKDVFQSNMDNLAQSFKDSGFQNLALEVSVQGERGRNGSQQQGERTYSFAQPVASDGTGNQSLISSVNQISTGDGRVNLRA